jgi:Tol biopolymer transport system component
MSLSSSLRAFAVAALLVVLAVGIIGCGGSGSNTIYQQVVERATWSGNSIAFASFGGSSIPYIWLMNSDGSSQTVLTPALDAALPQGGVEPYYSPTGTQIAISGRRSPATTNGIYIMAAVGETSGISRLSPDDATGLDQQPFWVPAAGQFASQVAYTTSRTVGASASGGRGRIVVQNPTGGAITMLVDIPGRTATWAAVSRDGTKLAYTVYDGVWNLTTAPATANIYVKDITGTVDPAATGTLISTQSTTNLTERADRSEAPSFSATGDQIAFHSNRNGTFSIFRSVDLTGAQTPVVLATALSGNGDGYPVYSPDGTRIVYNGSRQIITINSTDGSGAATLTTRFQ